MNVKRACFYSGVVSSFVLFSIFYLPTGNAINIVSPFSFNVYVIPIKLPIQIGSDLSSLVALGALVVAKLALIGTAFLKGHHDNEEEEYSIPFRVPQGHGGWSPGGPAPWKPGRRRRSSSWSSQSNDISETQLRILESIYKRDSHGCVLKFLCELGTIADASRLGLEERLILTLFSILPWTLAFQLFSPFAFTIIAAPVHGRLKLKDPLVPVVTLGALALTKLVLIKRIQGVPKPIRESEYLAIKHGWYPKKKFPQAVNIGFPPGLADSAPVQIGLFPPLVSIGKPKPPPPPPPPFPYHLKQFNNHIIPHGLPQGLPHGLINGFHPPPQKIQLPKHLSLFPIKIQKNLKFG